MQLNALFCSCLWRNVEASCHKHFVVFSRNQHRHLLPAMCYNLRGGGRGAPATVLTTPGVNSRHIGSESRFLPTPPAFDASVRVVTVGILPCRLELKNYNGLTTRWPKKFEDMFIRFHTIHEHDRQTDGHTHTETPHNSIASRGKNYRVPTSHYK